MTILDQLRIEIDAVDVKILDLLKLRFDLAIKIAKIKKENKIKIYQKSRESKIFEDLEIISMKKNIDFKFVKKLYFEILKESKRLQND